MISTLAEKSLLEVCAIEQHSLDEYESEMPRWCKGCGDHGVLAALQRVLRKNNLEPENVVAVSGIGCSSRLPHYLKTYGFHGIHGRALPISTGVRLARPELPVITIMGDGDCFSIGGNHRAACDPVQHQRARAGPRQRGLCPHEDASLADDPCRHDDQHDSARHLPSTLESSQRRDGHDEHFIRRANRHLAACASRRNDRESLGAPRPFLRPESYSDVPCSCPKPLARED